MKNLLLIKLGGSVITDKKVAGKVAEENIARLSREIALAQKELGNKTQIILGNGGGSISHPPAFEYKLMDGITSKRSVYGLAVTADAERSISRIVVKNLIIAGVNAMSFAPDSFITSYNRKLQKPFLDPILYSMNIGIVPTVHGDMIIDKSIGCVPVSTETVLGIIGRELAKGYKDITFISVGVTNGVYDGDKKTIKSITGKNFTEVKKFIKGSAGVDVTGGMIHKVEECLRLREEYKIKTVIINGTTPGELYRTMLGKKVEGTTIE